MVYIWIQQGTLSGKVSVVKVRANKEYSEGNKESTEEDKVKEF